MVQFTSHQNAVSLPSMNFIDEMVSPFLQNTASRYDVKAIPTFILFRNREVLHTVKGADVGAVEAVIAQHVTTEESGSVGKGGVSVKSAVSVPGQVRVGWEGEGERVQEFIMNKLTLLIYRWWY